MRFSLTSVLSLVFMLFIGNSIYNLIGIFRAPTCKKGDICYSSYLNSKPQLNLYLFVSDNSKSGNVHLVYKEESFNYTSSIEKELEIPISKTVRNNGTLYLHGVIVPKRAVGDDPYLQDLINSPDSTYLRRQVTKLAIPASATFNLLRDETKTNLARPVPHLMSKFVIVMCSEELNIPHANVPGELARHIRINHRRQFLPIVHDDIMHMRLKDLVEITPEKRGMNMMFIYNPISIGMFRFLVQIQMTLDQFVTLGFTEKDLDEVKGVFVDTNLYLLCATIFISSVHLLLDFLSFKNDVSFWRNHTSMAGLSSRTVLWRAFSQTVIFLYLLDEGTSLLVLIPSGLGTLIEFWKVSKVLKTGFSFRQFKFTKGKSETAEEIQTRQYDEECMKYLSYVLYPLCIGAAGYSLIYQPHRSWYSWTINSLVTAVYAFGFLFMLPQLFINYRLKSVAALPWRAFTYRAFNTFIDDLFAFIITMPTAHRVACFRDDLVFFIYLYQRWLYPVDKSRTDDIISGEESQEEKKKK